MRETACAHGDTWLKQGRGTTEIASRELAELVHLPAFYTMWLLKQIDDTLFIVTTSLTTFNIMSAVESLRFES